MVNDLERRLLYLIDRLRTTYDGIGHSSGRPYVYFVYPPDQERAVRRLVDEILVNQATLTFYHIDLLSLTIQSLQGQEERRQDLLKDPVRGVGAADSILRLWARTLHREIGGRLAAPAVAGRPVVVLRGLAALHPLGNPTSLMEILAEEESRDPGSGRIVPVVLLVPGIRPPQTSRQYYFLGQESLSFTFYRGEEA